MDERIKIGFDETSRHHTSLVSRATKQRKTILDLNDDKEGLINNIESDFEDDDDIAVEYDTILEKDLRPVIDGTHNRYENEGQIINWETNQRITSDNLNICSFSNESFHSNDKTDILTTYKGNRRISPRPAVVRTTWCDFSDPQEQQDLGSNYFDSPRYYNENVKPQWLQNELYQQQTLVAEHSIEWDKRNEDLENNESLLLTEDLLDNNLKETDQVGIGPYHDIYEHQDTNLNLEKDLKPMKVLKSTNIVRQKSKRKRAFQKFWCATDEDDEEFQELPRPDEYRLKYPQSSSYQKQRNKKNLGSSFKRKLIGNTKNEETLMVSSEIIYREDTDERGGIRRRPKVWECLDETELDFKKDAKIYAPKRPPPILDFFMVVTSFFVASVLAYYSAT